MDKTSTYRFKCFADATNIWTISKDLERKKHISEMCLNSIELMLFLDIFSSICFSKIQSHFSVLSSDTDTPVLKTYKNKFNLVGLCYIAF
jgi:hypothetical protein